LLASISHTTQKLRVSAVTGSLVSDVVQLVREQMPERESNSNVEAMTLAMIAPAPPASERTTSGLVVTAPRRGWVQQISIRVIGRAVAKGSFVRLDASVGSYVSEDAPLLTVWPPPADTEHTELTKTLRSAFAIGDERTLQQDIAFGLTMLEDIAVKALSPGVNDPNTAKVVIAQLGDVLLSILERELPPAHVDFEGRTIWRPNEHGYDDYVRLAFDQIRLFASAQPPVQLSLVTTLLAVGTELHRRGRATQRAADALNGLLDRVVVDMQIHARPGFPHPDLDEVLEIIGDCDWAVLERRDVAER
jgi:uncharacterized membrane protein